MTLVFLSIEQVERIHREQIAAFGGADGVRDRGALESAVAMPSAQFFGKYAHEDLFEMAAAYAFHIAKNHPFVDGNKRAGLAAALIFLVMNGVFVPHSRRGKLFEAMMKTAESKLEKKGLAKIFRRLAVPRSRSRAA